MADHVLAGRFPLERSDLQISTLVRAHSGLLALGFFMVIAAVLRLWSLESQALHHDESLHAQFSYYLFDGRGYRHDPLMHGPFLFHVGAASYFLFGDNEFTARLAPALFGVVLVGLPLLLRRQLGWPAVIIAAALLAFSPTLLYFSRFLRNDIYIAVWSLGMVVCVWRYLEEQKPVYLVALAALLALSFATKEVTFIFVAILLLFLNLLLSLDLARSAETESCEKGGVSWWRAAVLAPVAWLAAALWPFLGHRPFGKAGLPAVGAVIVVLGTLSLPQFGPAIQVLPFIGDDGIDAQSERTLRAVTPAILIAATAYVGLLWRPRLWLLVAAAFYVPFVLLFTTFFTNIEGFLTGIWGSLDYWLGQHDVRRGNQPAYYYALLTPLYEFLPLVIALAGAAWLMLARSALYAWLLVWTVAMFGGLSWAGEKMPWLEVHIALPLALVAAAVLGRLVERLKFDGAGAAGWLLQGLLAAAAVLLLVEAESGLAAAAALVTAGSLLAWMVVAGFKEREVLFRSLLVVGVAALFTLTVRASFIASFNNDDTPVEVLVYTQSSPDIPVLSDRIDAVARESGLGYNLPIVVDGTDGYAWPWAWYLRRYHSVAFVNDVADYPNIENAVLLVHTSNASRIDPVGFSQAPYKHRWWFNETYRDLSIGDVRHVATSRTSLESLGDFFLNRRPVEGTTGSTDGVAFFPVSLSAFDSGQTPLPPPEPAFLDDGRIVFGRTGNHPGEILQAADVFVDLEGNVWVADALASRIHKFSSRGVFLDSLGTPGSEPGQFNQPWSVVVDEDGFIYVADTWNHRIQKFAPDFSLVLAWQVPDEETAGGLPQFYGPRDLALAPDGTLWVADTGNKRLLAFSRNGELLRSFGEEGSDLGQFSEPVGLAVDEEGVIYIADTWNGRVQKLDLETGLPNAFDTRWSSTAAHDKPYLTILADGRVLVSDPERASLSLFSADGEQLGSWRPSDTGLPVGVAALPDGGFVFSDAQRNQLQIVPGSALDGLFSN